MEWPQALDVVVSRTRHERFRELCDGSYPEHLAWRARMVEQATGQPAPAEYPSLATMAGNVLKAAGRVAVAAVQGEPILVPSEVLEIRRAQCLSCEHNGERERGGIRCVRCGCGGAKLHLAVERCPLEPPRWGRWERSSDGLESDA